MFKKVKEKGIKDYDPQTIAWIREDRGELETPLLFRFPAANEKIKNSLKDAELINQFKEIDLLPKEEKNILLKIVGAYIRDYKAKLAYR